MVWIITQNNRTGEERKVRGKEWLFYMRRESENAFPLRWVFDKDPKGEKNRIRECLWGGRPASVDCEKGCDRWFPGMAEVGRAGDNDRSKVGQGWVVGYRILPYTLSRKRKSSAGLEQRPDTIWRTFFTSLFFRADRGGRSWPGRYWIHPEVEVTAPADAMDTGCGGPRLC